MLEVFLALTFRPWDSHCIHVDVAAPEETRAAVERVVGCYKEFFPHGNIFTVRGIVKSMSVDLLEHIFNVGP